MNCPRCGHDSRVTDSRPWHGTSIRRWRLCPSCGYRFTTLEFVVEIARGTPR